MRQSILPGDAICCVVRAENNSWWRNALVIASERIEVAGVGNSYWFVIIIDELGRLSQQRLYPHKEWYHVPALPA